MSPVPPPPPAGTFIPSDDWTEDPSFDLSPSAHHFALPTSPSSSSTSSTSTSHRSHSSISNARQHASSPLRQSYTGISSGGGSGKGTLKLKKGQDVEELLDGFDDDFDLPDTFPPSQPQSHAHSQTQSQKTRPRSSTSSSITRTVIGNGPTGVGTITKLGTISPNSPIMKGTVRARAMAIEKSWEADVDFDDIKEIPITSQPIEGLPRHSSSSASRSSSSTSAIRRMTLSPPRKGFMPSADALDDLGFDLDVEDQDQDQATLKAGATLKAMLPPPRPQPRNEPTLRPAKSSSTPTAASTASHNIVNVPSTPPAQDPDSIDLELESDFALPLNLTNLTLATQPKHLSKAKGHHNKPRHSNASTATTNGSESWGSPNSSTKKSGWGWGSEDSPSGSGINKRRSETSATSISDCLPETPNESRSKNILVQPTDDFGLDDEDNMETGLILPSPTFFSNQRSKELNSLLDKKRKPQFAPTPSRHHAHHHHSTATADESFRRGHQLDDSFEDGLVLDEPGVELSKHRLKAQKRARDKYPTSTFKRGAAALGSGSGGATKSVAKEREKAWEKQREQGWGRITPVPFNPPRERTQSSLGLSFRSNSASATTLLRDNTKRVDSPSLTGREKESMRSRSGHIHSMLPPPVPSSSQSALLPSLPPSSTGPSPVPQQTPTSRLRHQKSHYHIAPPPQSPSLARKQSLASLQDALADKTFTMADTPRYHNSTSRLTMPTSSSKAKTRPPINSIFPTSISGPSSTSHHSHTQKIQQHPSYHGGENVKRMVDMPRRHKAWGDGSELDGIDDLTIDDEHKSTIKGSSISSLGLGKPSRRAPETSHPRDRSNHLSKPVPAPPESEKRKKSGSGTASTKRKNRKPALIKHFGVADKKKVVGEMTWNPSTLRWEGNESILRDFDTISASARPALITHYTGSSVGVGGLSSPVGSTASAPRIVGDMQFDPVQMKWISILSPEEDEPDPFEGMADDEDEDYSGLGGGTITRSSGRKFLNKFIGSGGNGNHNSNNWTSRLISESSIASSTATTATTISNSLSATPWEGDEGAAMMMVSGELWKECRAAEERHKKEMKGWISKSSSSSGTTSEMRERERERKEEKRLWEIRNLAMKS
ncbi:uncharacterized protein I303_105615 [Kwoniella dejecticola CBS 10117]|uniref:GTPase activator n=1 Tax=Kwoniella dejecticola CBS 10117 TaxID=1296121 RepID=A0A1A6A1Z4_9TREE|nr:uncharacterized protein I303_04942 [Kwoniella dejecticola CBS 10117]OBR84085.1 hypothetical protein I303_04942 [Kwoniella dejecticola CBS 10117]